jgi:hypothetical protein
MFFLAPYMLIGTAAAGIPIALHFFFRSRYRTIPWAAMTFLLTSIEQTSRRLRFQELLLLLARVAVLLLLAFALARPLWSTAGEARTEPVDAVLLIDNSFSMGADEEALSRDEPAAKPRDRTRLESARKAALDVIDKLPPHSTVQLITCADRATLLGPAAASDLDQARELVRDVKLTHLASDVLPGVKEATAALRRGQLPNKELYIFSDMQKLGWDNQGEPLAKALRDVHEQAPVYLVRCGTKVPGNVAVVGIVPQAGVLRPGERVGFAVLVRNTGARTLRNLEVTLTVRPPETPGKDKKEKSPAAEKVAVEHINPGETRAVTLTGQMGPAGLNVVSATAGPDELDADNRLDQVLLVRDHVRVLVIDGAPHTSEPGKAASFFLMHALLPVKETDRAMYHLQPRLVTAAQATPGLLADQDLCILANVAVDPEPRAGTEVLSAEFVEQLAAFVRQGHGLLIFGGDRVQPKAYNRVLSEQHKLLPLKLKAVRETPEREPLRLDRGSAGLPAYLRFRDDSYYKGLNQVEVWKTLEFEEEPKAKQGEGATVALRYNNHQPAVVARKVEAGEVLFVATAPYPGQKENSIDPTWTDWPLQLGMYVPFIDVTVGHLLHGQTQNHNAVAGAAVLWPVAEKDAGRSFFLTPPQGEPLRLGPPERLGGRPVLTLTDLANAGVYRLSSRPASEDEATTADLTDRDKDPGVPLAVAPDLRESADLSALSDEELDTRLGFRPTHVVAGADPGSYSGVDRANEEWTPWVLIAVLAVGTGEMLLAWFCGRTW